MRFRKVRLGLPLNHRWTLQDWVEFAKLDSKQLAEELQVPVEQVEDGLFLDEEPCLTERPCEVSCRDICHFVGRGCNNDLPNPQLFAKNSQLNASMYRAVFGTGSLCGTRLLRADPLLAG